MLNDSRKILFDKIRLEIEEIINKHILEWPTDETMKEIRYEIYKTFQTFGISYKSRKFGPWCNFHLTSLTVENHQSKSSEYRIVAKLICRLNKVHTIDLYL